MSTQRLALQPPKPLKYGLKRWPWSTPRSDSTWTLQTAYRSYLAIHGYRHSHNSAVEHPVNPRREEDKPAELLKLKSAVIKVAL